jgi:enterobactin synthetase component D
VPESPGEVPGLRSLRRICLPWTALAYYSIHLIDFDLASFKPEAFARCGVAMPDCIAASVPSRQADFFFGRLAAQQALRCLGRQSDQIGIGAAREPRWPPGVAGSITHCLGRAAAVALPAHAADGVGIDLETVVDETSRSALIDTVFSGGDSAVVRDTTLPLDTAVTLVFSAKESIFKALFPQVGSYFDFTVAGLLKIDSKSQVMSFELREALGSTLRAGTRMAVAYQLVDVRTVATVYVHRPHR